MTSLHLTPLAPNMTEVRIQDKYVLFSYQTPVAYSDNTGACFKTSKKWSNTTTKHITKCLDGRPATVCSQLEIDELVK